MWLERAGLLDNCSPNLQQQPKYCGILQNTRGKGLGKLSSRKDLGGAVLPTGQKGTKKPRASMKVWNISTGVAHIGNSWSVRLTTGFKSFQSLV